ncbi:MAG: FHA domain-containing protein [Cyanobacteria bacterium J06642_2]
MAVPTAPTVLNHALILKDRSGPKAYWLTATMYTIGRSPRNNIRIDSDYASRHHAILVRIPSIKGGYTYQVLDGDSEGNPSTNGVFVNGQKVDFHDLKNGDEIRFSSDATATYLLTEKTLDFILSTYERTQLLG